MATVSLKSIDELFGQQFFVPSYQRGFRWTDVQIKELVEDLYDFVKSDDKGWYCLQPIIVKKRYDKWELVDGQQRLTAIWLVFALYCWKNREDLEESSLADYQYCLEYEKKDPFTKVFEEIVSSINDKTFDAFLNKTDETKERSIDSRYLIEGLETINKHIIKNSRVASITRTIAEECSRIKIIWYELDEAEDPIQVFTKVNANKIELTNAELIKAILLNHRNDDKAMAHQWDEIEKGLRDNSFWGFITKNKKESQDRRSRIDFLFELWYNRQLNADEGTGGKDRYAVFRAVDKRLKENKGQADSIWSSIKEIYETLRDWYDDYYYYHMIGLLVEISEGDIGTVKDLYGAYSEKSKNEFKTHLKIKIKEKCTLTASSKDDLITELSELSYQRDREKLENVLLLYNIAMLVNAKNSYERFPFNLYKSQKFDIEHVNPQTPQEPSEDDKINWLEDYRVFISNSPQKKDYEQLLNDIDECLKNNCVDFETVSDRISERIDIDIDSLGNLVLLDAETNRSYKNAVFAGKRDVIIRKVREGKTFIPIATKWVFLKGFPDAKSLFVWGAEDMKEYIDDVANSINLLLEGGVK